MYRRQFPWLVGGWLGVLGATVAVGPQVAEVEEAVVRAEVVLRLPAPPSFRVAGYHEAVRQGFFAAEGLEVVLYSDDGDGAADPGATPATYVVGGAERVLARLHGSPLVMVAAVMQETPWALRLAEGAPDVALAGVAALTGRAVAVPETGEAAPLWVMLRRAGIEGATDGGGAVAEAALVTAGPGQYVRPADHGVTMFYGDALFTSEAELAHQPRRVEAVRRAVLRGWAYALRETPAVVAALAADPAVRAAGWTPERLRHEAEVVRDLVKPAVVPLGLVQETRVAEIAEALVELGWAAEGAELGRFVYEADRGALPRWIYWGGAGLACLSTIGLAAVWFNVRLQRRVQERTAALQRSEARSRDVFEQAPVALLEEDYTAVVGWLETARARGAADGAALLNDSALDALAARVRLVAANRAALKSQGRVDAAQLAAQRPERLSAEERAVFRRQLGALERGERELTAELGAEAGPRRWGSGLMRWSVPLVDGRPDYTRVLTALTDVAELRAAQERLAESEARFRTLFESAIEGVYESTPDEGIVEANPAMARLLGTASPAECVRWCRKLGVRGIYMNERRREEFLALVDGADEVLDFESEVRCADGTRKWIAENVRVVRDEAGRLVRFQGFVSDISERKRFEQALGEERERLAVTLRAMAEGVITTDRDGVVHYMNEAAERITGWAEGAAVGRKVEAVCQLQHERTRAAVPVPWREAMSDEGVLDLPPGTRLLDRQGVPYLVEGRCAPIHDLQSRPVGVVLVLRDVTERSRLEGEMLRASKLDSLGVLAGGIAHDFNNILTVVLGNLTLAMLDSTVMEMVGSRLRETERAALRARELTQQLLTFAKGGDPVRAAVNLAEVVKEAAQFALHGARVKCEFDLGENIWPADVDKGQIGQVVQNLVINAVQAMPQGGRLQLRLKNERHPGDAVSAMAPGPYLRLEIADEGEGIRPEHLARIFDPYFSTKPTGSGLGLATVYSIAKKHAGHVAVESEVGRGTTFRVWLPAAPEAEVEREAEETVPASARGRVLFMDDEDNICHMAEALFHRLGYDVTTVRDGADVVRLYAEARERGEPFDVVMMDLTVPGGMGGCEALVELRKIDQEVRAIVSSGYSSDPVLAHFTSHGFRGRVAKPYRIADLAKALREVLVET